MGGVRMEFYHDILENLLDKLIDYRGKTPKKTLTGVPLVTAKIVKNGTINGYTEYIAEEDYDKWMVRGFPKVGDVILTTEAPLGEVAQLKEEKVALAQRIVCLRGKDNVLDNTYLKYYLQSGKGQKSLSARESGTTVTGIKQAELRRVDIEYPAYDDQRRIASILSSLDRKIELNNKINADLEEMAQAIFKNWFVDFEPFKDGKFVDSELGMIPEGWKVGRLTEIASYMNGLAMQKFPPENNEDSLPVLKIKELGQGFCGTDSDRCSCNIKDECKIHNGDVIFSWSGTLLVDVWCGGDCGLNQHLFKVTSKDYPKWFYYYWTKHHLQEFIHIAKDKAVTMGHIKRGHLEEAMVAIPDNDSMEKAHELFEPILSKMISLRLESSRLSTLRDTLLPRLMSGELEVPE